MDDTESTTTSADENTGNLCDNPTRDTLAEGLLGLLKPTVDQLDDRVRATRIAQLELKQQIDSLNEELQRVKEALNNHPDLDPYVKKLIACKHKVTVVLNVLQASQDRLNEIRHMIHKKRAAYSQPEKTEPEQTEDSFLLIDALEKDLKFLQSQNPLYCLEIGSGSGIVITALGMALPNCVYFSTDINFKACVMSKSTSNYNKVDLESVNMNLASCFIDNQFDVVIFNPPYVVTESLECNSYGIEASWAGGVKGREIIDKLLEMLPKILTDQGIFYLLLIEENIPEEVVDLMMRKGYKSELIIMRRVKNEKQLVFKFYR
ncbi:unnamed protein product [Leptosia nina]|uniref:Methyltransferase HEMK2 n=1 Tax=Leptosia nina TaxID=320188 RepID=A0AAV1JR70_9NEOP